METYYISDSGIFSHNEISDMLIDQKIKDQEIQKITLPAHLKIVDTRIVKESSDSNEFYKNKI